MIVIVLGMHRSGTSLVSSVLHSMGVKMGEEVHLERRDPDSQPQGYWEDQDFTSLNRLIIRDAKGHWHRPPKRERILQAARGWNEDMAQIIATKQKVMESENLAARTLTGASSWIGWGWKDPRSCLTIEAWWPHLLERDIRFVRVRRERRAIIDSLIRRGEQLGNVPLAEQRAAWIPVIQDHENRITNFFVRTGSPCIDIHYEHLVNRGGHIAPLTKIADLLGLEGRQFIEGLQAAEARIEFRG